MTVRRMGVDYGSRRVGLALSEAELSLAMPHATIELETSAPLQVVAEKIAQAAKTEEVKEIILGFPKTLRNETGFASDKVVELRRLLEKLVPVSVILWDERLSTALAKRQLQEGSKNYKQSKKAIDQMAAVNILQSYLDAQTRGTY